LGGEERPIVVPNAAMQNHPYGIFALDPNTGQNPTPEVIRERVIFLTESLRFLHLDSFGGEVNVDRFDSCATNLMQTCVAPDSEFPSPPHLQIDLQRLLSWNLQSKGKPPILGPRAYGGFSWKPQYSVSHYYSGQHDLSGVHRGKF
jgi:hypothetical protein